MIRQFYTFFEVGNQVCSDLEGDGATGQHEEKNEGGREYEYSVLQIKMRCQKEFTSHSIFLLRRRGHALTKASPSRSTPFILLQPPTILLFPLYLESGPDAKRYRILTGSANVIGLDYHGTGIDRKKYEFKIYSLR